jgi:hypothetical protein
VAADKIEVGIEVEGDLQTSRFEAGKRTAVRERFGFERARGRLSLGIIVWIARPAIAGQRQRFFDACSASKVGILTAAVGMDD